MHVSLSELSTTVAKASVAIGLNQGCANEVGRLVKFTTAYQVCSIAPFLDALSACDSGNSNGFVVDHAANDVFCAEQNSLLSALTVIAPIRDSLAYAHHYASESIVNVTNVDVPVLVAAIALSVSATFSGCVDLTLLDTSVATPTTTLDYSSIRQIDFKAGHSMQLQWSRLDSADSMQPYHHGTDIQDELWRSLERFANRLLVPATDESRLTGAGAGLNEID